MRRFVAFVICLAAMAVGLKEAQLGNEKAALYIGIVVFISGAVALSNPSSTE